MNLISNIRASEGPPKLKRGPALRPRTRCASEHHARHYLTLSLRLIHHAEHQHPTSRSYQTLSELPPGRWIVRIPLTRRDQPSAIRVTGPDGGTSQKTPPALNSPSCPASRVFEVLTCSGVLAPHQRLGWDTDSPGDSAWLTGRDKMAAAWSDTVAPHQAHLQERETPS
ncbi:hypothetical protein GJAV_G00226820 [Gymnothorax javanicus]|nr:hypothetical protein GJAV_G00226820 [Gymnothorax javanicus]